jgi:hypothetical protein
VSIVLDDGLVVQYAVDETLGSDLEVFIVVKRVDQKVRDSLTAMRIRENGGDPSVMKRGSAENKSYHQGFVGRFSLSSDLSEPSVRRDTKQPTGILCLRGSILVSAGDSIEVLDEHTLGLRYSITHPWFARLHSIASRSGSILVASSAYDLLIELDFDFVPIREFCLWDHGYAVNHEGRSFARSIDPRSADVIVGPMYRDGLGVSTAKIPNHVNGVHYINRSTYIASMLHRGSIVAINPTAGTIEVLIEGLSNPHLSGITGDGRYLIADTSCDQVLLYDLHDPSRCDRYSISGVAKKRPWIASERWLQNVTELRQNMYCAIDSPSRTLVLFDVNRKLRRNIRYSDDWAVQTVIPTE